MKDEEGRLRDGGFLCVFNEWLSVIVGLEYLAIIPVTGRTVVVGDETFGRLVNRGDVTSTEPWDLYWNKREFTG